MGGVQGFGVADLGSNGITLVADLAEQNMAQVGLTSQLVECLHTIYSDGAAFRIRQRSLMHAMRDSSVLLVL